MSYLVSSPFGALNQLNRELNRFFDDRGSSTRVAGGGHWSPHVDISESETAFLVEADIPGVNPKDIEISLHKGVLTIRGERTTDNETEGDNYSRRERVRGTFIRQFNLPDSADEETVSAASNNGVLQITIPKAKKSQPINVVVEGE